MRYTFLFITLLSLSFLQTTKAQDMDNTKLGGILYTISDQLEGVEGNWQFVIDSTLFICLTDQLHNRMRIISPVRNMSEVSEEQLRKCMEANFHTALDVKYAISEDVLWSAFIHPLQELTKEQVISALSQVYSAAKTFGTYYSSGNLSFPDQEERKIRQN